MRLKPKNGPRFFGGLLSWGGGPFGLEEGHEFGDEDERLRHARPFAQSAQRGWRAGGYILCAHFRPAGHHADDRRDGLNERAGKSAGSMVRHLEDF